VLQIGVPAVVEWPHAWTAVTLQATADVLTVQTMLKLIPGHWPAQVTDTKLAEPSQSWSYASGRRAETRSSAVDV
jgi:hypothetical protein